MNLKDWLIIFSSILIAVSFISSCYQFLLHRPPLQSESELTPTHITLFVESFFFSFRCQVLKVCMWKPRVGERNNQRGWGEHLTGSNLVARGGSPPWFLTQLPVPLLLLYLPHNARDVKHSKTHTQTWSWHTPPGSRNALFSLIFSHTSLAVPSFPPLSCWPCTKPKAERAPSLLIFLHAAVSFKQKVQRSHAESLLGKIRCSVYRKHSAINEPGALIRQLPAAKLTLIPSCWTLTQKQNYKTSFVCRVHKHDFQMNYSDDKCFAALSCKCGTVFMCSLHYS